MPLFQTSFAALSHRNYRLYWCGQAVSTIGEWTQRVGQAWLVLDLSGSATLLGVTAGLQQLPLLLIGLWGGLLADRIDKRRFLMGTQALAAVTALTLAALTATGAVEVWMVLVLAFLLGTIKAVDRPARQAFVAEIVPPELIANAVTLNSIVFNAARTVGPAIAGVLIAAVGLAASFLFNAVTYLAVIAALALMTAGEVVPVVRSGRSPGQVREGLAYVWSTPELRGPVLVMAASGLLAYEWAVTLPLLARDAFGGDVQAFGAMFSAMGLGAVVGGVVMAGKLRADGRWLLGSGLAFSSMMVLTAGALTLNWALATLFLLGAASIAFRATANALLQLHADDRMRGRVMSILTIAVGGSTPVGAPLVGWLADTIGIRSVFALGGLATATAAITASLYVRRSQRRQPRPHLHDQPRIAPTQPGTE